MDEWVNNSQQTTCSTDSVNEQEAIADASDVLSNINNVSQTDQDVKAFSEKATIEKRQNLPGNHNVHVTMSDQIKETPYSKKHKLSPPGIHTVNVENPDNPEIGKRRRIQHDYRRLSSSGYLDDYETGRKRRFSSDSDATSASPSPNKAKAVLVQGKDCAPLQEEDCTEGDALPRVKLTLKLSKTENGSFVNGSAECNAELTHDDTEDGTKHHKKHKPSHQNGHQSQHKDKPHHNKHHHSKHAGKSDNDFNSETHGGQPESIPVKQEPEISPIKQEPEISSIKQGTDCNSQTREGQPESSPIKQGIASHDNMDTNVSQEKNMLDAKCDVIGKKTVDKCENNALKVASLVISESKSIPEHNTANKLVGKCSNHERIGKSSIEKSSNHEQMSKSSVEKSSNHEQMSKSSVEKPIVEVSSGTIKPKIVNANSVPVNSEDHLKVMAVKEKQKEDIAVKEKQKEDYSRVKSSSHGNKHHKHSKERPEGHSSKSLSHPRSEHKPSDAKVVASADKKELKDGSIDRSQDSNTKSQKSSHTSSTDNKSDSTKSDNGSNTISQKSINTSSTDNKSGSSKSETGKSDSVLKTSSQSGSKSEHKHHTPSKSSKTDHHSHDRAKSDSHESHSKPRPSEATSNEKSQAITGKSG